MGSVGARERWRVELGPVAPELPLRGWVTLEWGEEISIEPIRGAERLAALLPHRGVAHGAAGTRRAGAAQRAAAPALTVRALGVTAGRDRAAARRDRRRRQPRGLQQRERVRVRASPRQCARSAAGSTSRPGTPGRPSATKRRAWSLKKTSSKPAFVRRVTSAGRAGPRQAQRVVAALEAGARRGGGDRAPQPAVEQRVLDRRARRRRRAASRRRVPTSSSACARTTPSGARRERHARRSPAAAAARAHAPRAAARGSRSARAARAPRAAARTARRPARAAAGARRAPARTPHSSSPPIPVSSVPPAAARASASESAR